MCVASYMVNPLVQVDVKILYRAAENFDLLVVLKEKSMDCQSRPVGFVFMNVCKRKKINSFFLDLSVSPFYCHD